MGFGEHSCQADPLGLAFCWQGPSPGGFLSCLGLDHQEFLLGFWGKVVPLCLQVPSRLWLACLRGNSVKV